MGTAKRAQRGGWGLHVQVQCLSEKSVISLMEWQNNQGDFAMDGEIRSHTARMPRLRPVQFSIPFPIPLVKSDFEIGTEPVYAIPCLRAVPFSLYPLTVRRRVRPANPSCKMCPVAWMRNAADYFFSLARFLSFLS